MSAIKFACPTCNQHIQIDAEFDGRQISCPSCQTKLVVPSPPKRGGKLPTATLASPAVRPKAVATIPTKGNPAPAKPQPKPAPTASAPTKPGQPSSPAQATTVAPLSDLRVAVLIPQLKLEIVRAVQSRLADKSRWLAGKKEAGEYNYAARREGDQLITVPPIDVSATHFSLFGAMLLELHRRHVLRVTTGRRRFLDEELTAAIQQVLGKPTGKPPVGKPERQALTHPQCLAVLDLLAKRYEPEAKEANKRKQERKVAHVRLADLVKKLEKRTPLQIEEVACALYYEMEELNQRLDKLEQNSNSD